MNPTTQQLPGRGRPRGKVQPTPRLAGAVPPAQYDVMRAPTWTTSPAPAARAGADDHKRIQSRGFRC
ncbi:hypothetical protein BA022_15860 [Diaphorobacter nitroreducens]|uniref:hypothetical protein n=1 Tax=Diaphorobacter nitroreducens TaxID=164759 RepID=UPI000DC737A9|nr:hypothetical protein [Diaphorobacter nitroreducens]ASI69894.1 hypothetical protein BA022_15860 [Diaphorobacter nitroreducens]